MEILKSKQSLAKKHEVEKPAQMDLYFWDSGEILMKADKAKPVTKMDAFMSDKAILYCTEDCLQINLLHECEEAIHRQ